MKIMHGWWSLAYPNISLINLALSPIYLSTMALDTTCGNEKPSSNQESQQKFMPRNRKPFYLDYCHSTKLDEEYNYYHHIEFFIFTQHSIFTIKFVHMLKALHTHTHKQLTLRKLQSNWEATALASRVFPVPGGPYNKHPLGGVMPTLWNNSGFNNGNSITYKILWNVLMNFHKTKTKITIGEVKV